MLRTIIIGFFIGIALAVGVGGWMPLVAHERLTSITRVAPNGGRIETFRISLPDDRLVAAAGVNVATVTESLSLNLPAVPQLADTQVELFRIRDTDSNVIGLASRTIDGSAGAADWLLYFPARGALFLRTDESRAAKTGSLVRTGRVLGGTESMASQIGTFEERRVFFEDEADGTVGERIEISTSIESEKG